ncbi:DsbA family oxidoreductase [Curtobacterium sp. ODYSSEY 48 V2]|uniref:DsbA family oxidoreductase n=1 Tax=Curtobacterium sp. ODYSSEY 48 V2 TaxID=2939561 RepID=UPI00203D1651|nr:DsbA family oxidoreductase [Curtobacterium sp. ODYSSEY 48 V2]MCM3506505.1 DsbA family oxidoreductase [Curtobacterium sp. ODYSSEY 48 V2]
MSETTTPSAGTDPVVIDVWADLGCPWCYVGKHRLTRAIQSRPDADRFTLRLHSFELNPNTPTTPETIEAAFIRAHGGDASVVLQAERHIQGIANREGLAFDLDRPNANTFTFHRVLQFADTLGLAEPFFSTVQDGFFAGTLNPFDVEELVSAAVQAGLPADEVRQVLASDDFADAVRADIADGRALGVTGVPFVVFDHRYAAAGAQSEDGYRQALEQVARESAATR